MKKLISLLLIFNLLSSSCFAEGWGTQKSPLGIQLDHSNPITKGLVGCWIFNEGGGDKVYDLSGYGNTGTLTNMAFPSTTSSGWNPGRDGSAIAFDGTNDYISIGDKSSLNNTEFTILARVKSDRAIATAGQYWYIANRGSIYDAGYGLEFYDKGIAGTEGFEVWSRGVGFSSARAEKAVSDTTIIHDAVGTRDKNGDLKIYVDGNLKNTITSSNAPNTEANSFQIGDDDRTDAAGLFWDGIIYFVFVWNRALTPQEIQELYINPYGMCKYDRLALWKAAIAAGQIIWVD